jgi:hypothetical protein
MTESQFTKGPWTAAPADSKLIGKNVVAWFGSYTIWSGDDVASFEREHNARIGAAAPEMFEALSEIVKWNGVRGDGDELLPPEKQPSEIAAAMRALAKATNTSTGQVAA